MSRLLWTFFALKLLDVHFSFVYSSIRKIEHSFLKTMNKRQENLLSYLLNNQDYEPVELLADHFSVSVKTIRRDLTVLNDLISEFDARIDLRRGRGIRLDVTPEAISKLQKEFIQSNNSFQDRRERNLLEAFFLLFAAIDHVPVKAFANLFYISHSQLLLDLKTIANVLTQYQIEINVDKDGVKTSGQEKDINDLLVYLSSQYYDYGYPQNNIRYPIEINKGSILTRQLITHQDIDFIDRVMQSIEEFIVNKIWKQDYVIISISLMVLLKRKSITTPRLITKIDDRDEIKKYSIPVWILNEIEKEYSIRLNEDDLQTITNIFLSTGLAQDPAFRQASPLFSNRQQLVYDFAEDFIDAFMTITDINLRGNAAFCLRIHDHIGPMINRVMINLGIADRLLDTYAQEYHSTMNICEVICWVLAKKYGLPDIPRAEVLFLMLYIQTEIIEAESRLKVGLLSNDEKSIVNLQLARLVKEFSNWEIVQYQQLSKTTFYKDALEFVIATRGNHLSEDLPVVEVSGKMSELDLRLIKAVVFNLTSNSQREFTKLQNIFRDLLDLGCQIVFSKLPFEQSGENRHALRIEGVGNTVFNYLDTTASNNLLYVQCPQVPEAKFEFTFSMNNWDFLLFASKIVYHVDRTNPADLDGSIVKIASHLKEINV